MAPDSLCFADRRGNKSGIEPSEDPDDDILQHYNEMCYRLLKGTTLMKKVVDDSAIAISLISQLKHTKPGKIGLLGHSYGGNTAIFHSPFDERIQFTCSSGAVCSYKRKFKSGTGIEMAEVIPNFTDIYDIKDLLRLVAPRKLLIMSATKDIYSEDAGSVFHAVKTTYENLGSGSSIIHKCYEGGHGLDQSRFDFIVNWFVNQFNNS